MQKKLSPWCKKAKIAMIQNDIWHEMDRCALQSVIAKELILIDKEAR